MRAEEQNITPKPEEMTINGMLFINTTVVYLTHHMLSQF